MAFSDSMEKLSQNLGNGSPGSLKWLSQEDWKGFPEEAWEGFLQEAVKGFNSKLEKAFLGSLEKLLQGQPCRRKI